MLLRHLEKCAWLINLLVNIKWFLVGFKTAFKNDGAARACKFIPVYLRGKTRMFFRHWAVNKSIKNNTECGMVFGNENPGKTFYLISIDEGWCGLFAIVVHQLGHIARAVDKGMIPVVDLQNNPSQYLAADKIFQENAWEYFFEQPVMKPGGGAYSLADVNKAKNVVINKTTFSDLESIYYFGYKDYNDASKINHLKKYYEKHIRLNAETARFVERKHAELFANKNRVIGVHCRGTDFTALKPPGHPIQPRPESVIEKCDELIKLHDCDALYLATEDAGIYSLFEKHYGGFLIRDNGSRWNVEDLKNNHSNCNLMAGKSKAAIIQNGLEYIGNMCLLTKCKIFAGSATRGSMCVKLMPNHFEYEHSFDLGYYQ